MPRRFDRSWLTCVLAAAASWTISLGAMVTGHWGMLIIWLVAVAIPLTVLTARLYPVQLRTIAAYRAYRLGQLHAQENEAAYTAKRTAIK
ncbi:hypothetical protein AB0G05_19625 [Nonomuraea wenchangensis]